MLHAGLRKSIICFSLSVLPLSFVEASVRKSVGYDSTVYKVEVEGVRFQPTKIAGRKFVVPEIKGVVGYDGLYYNLGLPYTPVVRIAVDASEPSQISITHQSVHDEKEAEDLSATIMPVQPSVKKVADVVANFRIDQAHYEKDQFWPTEKYKIEKLSSVKGRKKLLVTLFPLSFNVVTGQYKYTQKFEVKVKRSGVKEAEEFDYVSRNNPVAVFVIGAKFAGSAALQEYIEYKEKSGQKVEKIIVGSDVKTDDDIRKKIQGVYAKEGPFLKYALIIGDFEDVPAHRSTIIRGYTDHYYRAIDTADYATDINGPDIAVGRISVKDEAQLKGVVDKFIKYSERAFTDKEWLKRLSFVGTDDRYETAEGSHNYVIDNYTKELGFTGTYPQNPTAGGDKLYAITHRARRENLLKAFQEGRALIEYSGHGGTTLWAGPDFSQENVRSLAHPDAIPFVVSNACITSQFTVSESFGETWLRHPKGAVFFWGSFDSTYWGEDDILERRFYDNIFKNNVKNIGENTHYALGELWKHLGGAGFSRYYWETYVALGDPSMNLAF